MIDKDAVKIAGCKEKAGMFVLITNQLNKENLKKEDKKISLPGRRKTFTPTAMFRVFESVKVVAIATNENV